MDLCGPLREPVVTALAVEKLNPQPLPVPGEQLAGLDRVHRGERRIPAGAREFSTQ